MAKVREKVVVLTTGGTFDKSYSESAGVLENRETQLRNSLLSKLRYPGIDLVVFEIMAKDSIDMDDGDRELVARRIEMEFKNGNPVVLLHGTDTLEETANYCFKKYPNPKVPVVFTGAMKPIGFVDSDAPQNFVEALFAARFNEPGYYVTFHGQLFTVPDVEKDREKGTFRRRRES